MDCQRCKSARVISISAKCSDAFYARLEAADGIRQYDGYMPADLGIGDHYGDYVEFRYCAACGQIQGTWPLAPTGLEGQEPEADDAP